MTDSIAAPSANSLVPANETERLAALHRYHILDTSAETAFDRITSMAARLFKVPTVLISLVDESRAWFKSSIGFDASEVPRDATICSFAVLTEEPLIVPDTQLDERFACNPFVLCEPGLRFYAGAPLLSRDGYNLGTLCLLDSVPREPLTAEQEATLVDLAAIVVDELELRLAARQVAKVDAALLEITSGVATRTGDAFAEALVVHFAKVLGVDYAYIGLIEGEEPKMMRTIATCDRGLIVANLEYLLQDTPCWEAIAQRKICCYPRNVQAEFPHAPLLAPLGVESYIAAPFCNAQGEVIGVLGVMDGKPLENLHLAQSLLTIFAERVATEIERQQAERELQESQRLAQSQLLEIEAIYHTAPVGLTVLDRDLRYQRINQGLAEINGIAIEDHIGRTVREIVPDLADEAEPLLRRILETGEPLLNLEISGETNAQPGVWRTWIENWYPIADETGQNVGINVVTQEITDRKRTELLLAEQTRLLEAIATGQTLDDCLSQVCKSVAKLSPNTRACVLLTDEMRSKFPRSIAPDFPPSFGLGLQDAPISDLAIGTCATAVYCGEPVTCADVANDGSWSEQWRDLCVAHGILACHSTPIVGSDGLPWGSLMLCFSEARLPTEWEDRLAEFGTKIASITIDRKQSIERLSQSEERLSLALAAADMATWDADLATGNIIWSANHFELLGYAPVADGAATVEMWQSRVHPDDLVGLMQTWEMARQERSLYNVEYRSVRADNGRVVWLAATGRFIYDRSGAAVRFTGVIFDITERKVAEAAVANSQQRLQTVLDAIPHAVWVVGADGEFHFSNQKWFDFYGISFSAATAQGWSQVNPDDWTAMQRVWETARQVGMPYEFEFRWHVTPESERWYLTRAEPIRDETGQIVEWVGTNTDITHLKQVEAALQKSHARFQAAMQAVEGIVFEWNFQTQTVYRSEGLFDLIGVRAEDATPTHEWWQERVHPDDLHQIGSALPPTFVGFDRYESEYRVRHEAGHWVYVWERGYLQYDSHGELVGVVGFTTDITNRKQTEEELIQAQALAQRQLREIEAIYQTAPIGLTILDPDLRFQRVNQRLAEMNGVSISEHIGRTVRAVVPDVSEQNEPILRQVLTTGEPLLNLEISGETPAQPGVYRTWIQNCYPLTDETGESIGINVVVQEITDRKRNEAELARVNSILYATIDGTSDIIFVKDLQGRYVLVNSTVAKWLSTTVTAMIGCDDTALFPPEIARQIQQADRQVMQTGESIVYEEEIPDRSSIRSLLSAKYPWRDAAGEVIGVIGISRDITDRKRAEVALTERNQELDSFVHVVSHDLKAPLRAISNLSQWIEDDLEGKLPPDNQEQFQLLRARVKRMESMIDSLLMYARAGRQQAVLETFNVADLLSEIIDSIAPAQSFTITIQPPLPTLTTNRLFLSQVLTNLISNAVKHHPSPEGHLDIATIDRRDCYEFVIKDDGAGIAPENHAKIFGIFHTLKGKDNSDSTGVGLAIVKKIVETEGGTIRVESELGRGTTFYVTWPKMQG
jgi:PAS domain S-box-containing protein